jgi:hypothetical protein
MNLPMVDRIVNALLYEGYILYPYRASAVKNQLRFNFGVVYPRAYAEAQSGSDAWTIQTECLADGGSAASLEIRVRFLRVVDRVVGEGGEPGGPPFRATGVLRVDGHVHENWQEAVECRVDLPIGRVASLLATPLYHGFFLPREQEYESVRDAQGRTVGAVLRTRDEIRGVVEAHAEAVRGGISRITVRIVNLTGLPSGSETPREAALARSLVSTHTVLGIEDGEFVSLLEPPARLREAAAECHNQGAWPVLVGAAGERNTVLSSPIILYDYPAIAPESPGELFDSTEIDEILTLRVLTMTEEEKNEARRTDERARRIIERAETLSPEQFAKLHGTFREAVTKEAGDSR